MKIAVLGGNGYLGHHVTKYFNATPLSRRTGFDITKPRDCEQLKDYDVVIHMAAHIDKDEKEWDKTFDVNVGGTINVLKALRKKQVFIFTSTKDVLTEYTGYAWSKTCGEVCIPHFARKKGLRTGVFRLSTTYAPHPTGGNFVNYIVDSIKVGKEITLLHRGKQTRDFLYVDDLSRAFENFIIKQETNGVWNIGGGMYKATTMLGLVTIIECVLGKNAKIKFSGKKPGGQLHYVTDLDKIFKELHWIPTVSLPEGIERIIQ